MQLDIYLRKYTDVGKNKIKVFSINGEDITYENYYFPCKKDENR